MSANLFALCTQFGPDRRDRGKYCENCHVGHVVTDDVLISGNSEA